MKRRLSVRAALALTCASIGSAAQPASLPSGHPPVGSAEAPASQPPSPSGLPPGHPPVGSAPEAEAGADRPSAQHPSLGRGSPPQDRITPAPDLAKGTIEVRIADETGRPVQIPVQLSVLRQSIEQGDSVTERKARTNADGFVTFEGLSHHTAFSYRVTVQKGRARYASDTFQLQREAGHRVLLHVFPSTPDINQALVGMRGILFIVPRQDVFRFEASYRIFNIGTTAWVPDGLRVPLPPGAKGFQAQDGMHGVRAVEDGNAVRLEGTFPPGQREIAFSFQLDNDHDPERSFHIALPPHVAEMRVGAEAGRGMELAVSGFPDAQPMQGQDGTRLLVAGRQVGRGQDPMRELVVTLTGMPVPSNGRWYAVAIAAGAVLLGLWTALGKRSTDPREAVQGDVDTARELLLNELLAVERLHQRGDLGPSTYERTKTLLLDALARLCRPEHQTSPGP